MRNFVLQLTNTVLDKIGWVLNPLSCGIVLHPFPYTRTYLCGWDLIFNISHHYKLTRRYLFLFCQNDLFDPTSACFKNSYLSQKKLNKSINQPRTQIRNLLPVITTVWLINLLGIFEFFKTVLGVELVSVVRGRFVSGLPIF